MTRETIQLKKINPEQRKSLDETDVCFCWRDYTCQVGYEHSKTNSLISNLKKKTNVPKDQLNYKTKAINEVALEFKQVISENIFREYTFVPLPPSKTKSDPLYDNRILKILETVEKSIGFKLDIQELIIQKKSTEADHESEERLSKDQLCSICECRKDAHNLKQIIIFDDVITSGTHFKAMKDKILEHYSDVKICGLFIAQTINPSL